MITDYTKADDVYVHLTMNGPGEGFLYVDTGASRDIICDSRLIVSPEKHVPASIRITTGNGVSYAKSTGPATFQVLNDEGKLITITRNVIYCPDFSVNLFSPAQDYKEHGTTVAFGGTLLIDAKEGKIPFVERNGSYRLYYQTVKKPVEQYAALTSTTTFGPIGSMDKTLAPDISRFAGRGVDSTQGRQFSDEPIPLPRRTDDISLWHRRLGHQAFSTMMTLPVWSVGPGFKLSTEDARTRQHDCVICNLSSMKQAAHPQNRTEVI